MQSGFPELDRVESWKLLEKSDGGKGASGLTAPVEMGFCWTFPDVVHELGREELQVCFFT